MRPRALVKVNLVNTCAYTPYTTKMLTVEDERASISNFLEISGMK